jgi:hypothetical protein
MAVTITKSPAPHLSAPILQEIFNKATDELTIADLRKLEDAAARVTLNGQRPEDIVVSSLFT